MTRDPDGGWLVVCVGARRSGTHLLQRVLTTHPQVVALPAETHLFSEGLGPLADRLQSASPASPTVGTVYVPATERRRLLRDLADAILLPVLDRAPDGTTRLLERTPQHVERIELVTELYPAARIVHIVRDGRAVVTSLVHQDFGPDAVESAAAEWRDAVEAGRRQGARAAHYHEVRYEQLVADPATTARELFAELDLPTDDEVVAAAVAEASVRANTWGAPTDRGLSRRQRRVLDRVAGPVLDTLAPLGAPAPPARPRRDPHWSRQSIHHGQLAVDRLVEALASPDASAEDVLTDVLAPTATVRVLDHDGERRARAADGARAVLDLLADDVAGWPVTASDVQPSADLVVVHAEHRHADGTTAARTLVARLGREGIVGVTQYRPGP